MGEALIEIAGITKVFGVGNRVVNALRGVDLVVEAGECMAVVGESGSGKTTLGNLILGIDRPSGGTIRYKGEILPMVRTRRLRRRIQLVQQNPMSALNPKRTILASVALPLAVHGLLPRNKRRARVAELLEVVGMSPDYMDRNPSALSGGQRQRVALARALAAEPDCIVLDEPTSSLDVSVQARVLELLVGLQKKFNLTYLFITHDLSVVRNISSRVSVLYQGRLVETGATEKVFARPRHRYTQMLLSSIPVATDRELALKPDWPWDREQALRESVAEVGCPFSPRCPFAIDPCRAELPRLEPIQPGQLAACYNPG